MQLMFVILVCMLVNLGLHQDGFVAADPGTPRIISDIFIDKCERYLRNPPAPIEIREYVTFEATYTGITIFIIIVVVTKETKRKSRLLIAQYLRGMCQYIV